MREKHLQWIYLRPFANAAPLPFHPIDPFPLSIFHSAHTHNPAFIAHLLTLFSVAATTLLCVHLVNCSLTTGCTDSHLGLGCGKLSGTSQQSFYQVHHLIFAQKRLQTRLCVCLCWWPPSVVFVSEQKSWRVFCNNLCVCVCVCVCTWNEQQKENNRSVDLHDDDLFICSPFLMINQLICLSIVFCLQVHPVVPIRCALTVWLNCKLATFHHFLGPFLHIWMVALFILQHSVSSLPSSRSSPPKHCVRVIQLQRSEKDLADCVHCSFSIQSPRSSSGKLQQLASAVQHVRGCKWLVCNTHTVANYGGRMANSWIWSFPTIITRMLTLICNRFIFRRQSSIGRISCTHTHTNLTYTHISLVLFA